MFKPMFLTDFSESRVNSLYKANIALNSGALVDIDLTDTSAIGKALGQAVMVAGSLKLASIASTAKFNEFGICIPNVTATGVPLVERMLGVATNFFNVPEGLNVAVYQPVAGDIIATTEYVGQLPGDVGATGLLDPTQTANFGAGLSIFNGRFRLTQSGEKDRAQFLGQTSQNGATLAIVRFG